MFCENDDVVVVVGGVTDGPSGTTIELTPSNTTVLRGSSLSIKCSTDANPMAHVFQFYLDDIYIGNSTSGLYNVTVTADGGYTCVPFNTVGKEQNATVVIRTVGKWNRHSHYICCKNGPYVSRVRNCSCVLANRIFHNWSPVADVLLSSDPFANRCLTFYPADVFEIKMKEVFPLTTSITSQVATFFFCDFL